MLVDLVDGTGICADIVVGHLRGVFEKWRVGGEVGNN